MTAHREALAELASGPQGEVDLARGALLIAQEWNADLDPAVWLARLDAIAATVRARVPEGAPPPRMLKALNAHLFDELGFRGNTDDYYDPRNSFLNEVLERRTGLPITLSIVYIAVAARLGVELQGVGMPGHFVVKLRRREGEVVIDPFHGGSVLTARELRERIVAAGGDPEHAARYLAASTSRQVLTRLLHNLKRIYLEARQFDDALRAVELLLVLAPWDLDEIRDRGLIHHRRLAYGEALRDLEVYAEHRPEAEDAGRIWENIQVLRARASGPG